MIKWNQHEPFADGVATPDDHVEVAVYDDVPIEGRRHQKVYILVNGRLVLRIVGIPVNNLTSRHPAT